MDKKLSVTGIADNLKSNKKPKFLTKIFRKLVLNKFSSMKHGYIYLKDTQKEFKIGNDKSDLRVNLEITSDEF